MYFSQESWEFSFRAPSVVRRCALVFPFVPSLGFIPPPPHCVSSTLPSTAVQLRLASVEVVRKGGVRLPDLVVVFFFYSGGEVGTLVQGVHESEKYGSTP
eukprot:Hpha_TRINITY_DN13263_c0_g1::TRINITY_DN13263_c0_g1_i2::g.154675::m.154675